MTLTGKEMLARRQFHERASNGEAKLCGGCGSWLCSECGCKLFRIEGGYACYGCGQRFGIDTTGVPFCSDVKGFRPGDWRGNNEYVSFHRREDGDSKSDRYVYSK